MLDNTHLSDMSLQFFLPVCGLSFDSLNNVFHRAEVFYFNKVQLSFMDCTSGVISKNHYQTQGHQYFLYSSSKCFIISIDAPF